MQACQVSCNLELHIFNKHFWKMPFIIPVIFINFVKYQEVGFTLIDSPA